MAKIVAAFHQETIVVIKVSDIAEGMRISRNLYGKPDIASPRVALNANELYVSVATDSIEYARRLVESYLD